MKTLIEIIKDIGSENAALALSSMQRRQAGLPATEQDLGVQVTKRFNQDEALRLFCNTHAEATARNLNKWLSNRGQLPTPEEFAKRFGLIIISWEEANERFNKQLQPKP